MARRRFGNDASHTLPAFLRLGREADSARRLEEAMADVVEELGFRYYALVQHGPLPPVAPGRFGIDNYPAGWRERFVGERLDRIDPVQRACRQASVGFAWTRLPELLRMQPRQIALLVDAAGHGIGEGFTVPLHQPGELAASCSFAVTTAGVLPEARLVEAEIVAHLAVEVVRRLTSSRRRSERGLSPRQRDCVVLMARGKSDWEIGRLLDLNEETVTGYLNAARRRYGVAKRTQLAIASLFDGEIGFDEVLGR